MGKKGNDKEMGKKEGYINQVCECENGMQASALSITSSKSHILAVENGKIPPDPPIAYQGHGDVGHPTSFLETLIHLLKGNIGSGLYAMGDAFKNAGLVTGSVLTLVLGFICVYSQHMLLKSAREIQRRTGSASLPTFAETVELSFKTGPPSVRKWARTVRIAINTFLCITQMGFCCVYFVFISDNVKKVMDFYGVELDVKVHMIFLVLPLMMSCWIRDLKFLVPFSLIANVLMTVGIGITMYFLVQDLPSPSTRNYFSSISSLPLFFGTAIYCFEGIGLVLPLQHEMRNRDQFTSRFGVLNIGMTIVGALLVSMGFLGYLKFGEDVEGSLTLNLPQSDVLAQAVQIILSVAVLFSYALQMYVPIEILWPEITRKWGPFRWNNFMEYLFRSILVLITFVLAEAIPHLNLFISLIGAVSSTALALFFPAIMDIVINSETGFGRFYWTLWQDVLIIAVGIIGFLTGTYVSIEAIVNIL